ncbi:hypothetical protein DXA26_10150 [Bacteroides fragilis]|nr:hypothetical protein DXA26_10150 [Bacteroides fragilis]RHK16476.1 hypothetical protein DW078_07555 [Bacteroides fragilis]THC62011.1 hypothetical protein E7X03_18545 [Bacteroides fragilis]THC68740.1 hypothetical protein E7X19_21375 [Bacteroides fragilis]THC83835.1 hypothetical protein E7X23_18230 [Bacteroides fragilis]
MFDNYAALSYNERENDFINIISIYNTASYFISHLKMFLSFFIFRNKEKVYGCNTLINNTLLNIDSETLSET